MIREGYRLNNPLLIAPGVVADPFVRSSDEGVVIDTIKIAESGDAVILRLYESRGRATTTSITTTHPHARAVETDLLESGSTPVDLAAFTGAPADVRR